jgi:FAD/FMN-containing dehydrogenase/Fe-S oxidoreductase
MARELIDVPAKTRPQTRMRPVASQTVDRRSLRRALESSIAGEVRFDAGTRALYTTGGSNYRQVPIGVVLPRSADDVVAAIAVAREHGAPILSRGGGTSLAGQCCNVAVIIDFSKYMHSIVEIDAQRKLARVQPGLILDHLRKTAEAEHGLTFGPDPSTHDHCTLGGMIGNNSCGVHSVQTQHYGRGPTTAHNVHELDIVLYDGTQLTVGETSEEELDRIVRAGGRHGEIYARLRDLRDRYADLIRSRYPDIPRRISGYNLPDLLPENGFHLGRALTGTESTCATILEAVVHLVDHPPYQSLLALGYDDAPTAADAVPAVMEHKPIGLEGIDEMLVEDMTHVGIHPEDTRLLPDGHGWLLVEFGGEDKSEADAKCSDLLAALKRGGHSPKAWKLFDDEAEEKKLWEVREAGLGATAFIPGRPDTYEGWEDSAVPPERLGEYLRRLKKLADRYGYESALYGHYGQGCVHARWNFDLVTVDGIQTFRRFLEEASDLVLELGGSLSGEHGDGQSRAELLPKMFGEELVDAFREFKSIWDPDWKMNPGKVVDPYRITDNLRLGSDYRPAHPDVHFAYPEDHGDFAHVGVRCVGIGKCRRTEGGVMCPSYMVTRDEKHTTRGRARLLFEMLHGDPVRGLWRSEEVKSALDLCLACKGCKKDCPVSVDMATYKAEFLSHYYARRIRPRSAYALGLIDRVARVASRAPRLTNAFASTRLSKFAAGIHPARDVPEFAPHTFKHWFEQRDAPHSTGRRVIVWPDTFTNFFHPEIGAATVELLESAGYEPVVPDGHLCCGRPLYDFGMLDLAKSYLRKIMDALEDDILRGTPVVGMEPSCLAVFRDELKGLFPNDENATRLCKQSFMLSEFLEREGWEPPPLARRVLVQKHCHHHAVVGYDAEQKLLAAMGLDLQLPETGCCGMAGSFGFERSHYDVSKACGERMLFPEIESQPEGTLLLADGFSCREQIRQGTGREAMHFAQLVRMAQQPA